MYILKKNRPSGAPGPASASPWRGKRRALPKLSTFLSQLKGGPFGEKTNFRKKSHNDEKLKGGTLWDFKYPICCKISKKLKGGPFGEKKKSHNAEKLKGGEPLRFFNIHFAAKHQKIERGKFFIFGKNLSAEKTVRGTLWDFPTSILTQNSKKNWRGEIYRKKSRSAEKMKGETLWFRPVWYNTRKNRKNLFGSVR